MRPSLIGKSSAVWCYNHQGERSESFKDPFSADEVVFFEPPPITERIVTQAGCFTAHLVHLQGTAPKLPGDLVKLVIDAKSRVSLRINISDMGIHSAFLFPGFDGAAAYVNWFFSRLEDEGSGPEPGPP